MAFGKKKETGPQVNQSNVAMLASTALAERRRLHVQLGVRLVTTAGILMHRWTQKAIIQMVSKMVGMDMPRESKDLTAEFEASWYRNTEKKLVIPCRIIKAALVNGAISTGGVVSKAQLNRELRVVGFTAPIYVPSGKRVTEHVSPELEHDIQIARTSSGSPDVRSRALVPAGSHIDIVLSFPPTLTPDKVMAALEAAGDTIGLCDFRPQTGGDLGTFRVDEVLGDAKTIAAISASCSLPEEKFVIPDAMLRAFNAIPPEKLTDKARKAKSLVNGANGEAHA